MYETIYREAIESTGLTIECIKQYHVVASAIGRDRLLTYVTVSSFTNTKRGMISFNTTCSDAQENCIENVTRWARRKAACHEMSLMEHELYCMKTIDTNKLNGVYTPLSELIALHAKGWSGYPLRYCNRKYICLLTASGKGVLDAVLERIARYEQS